MNKQYTFQKLKRIRGIFENRAPFNETVKFLLFSKISSSCLCNLSRSKPNS